MPRRATCRRTWRSSFPARQRVEPAGLQIIAQVGRNSSTPRPSSTSWAVSAVHPGRAGAPHRPAPAVQATPGPRDEDQVEQVIETAVRLSRHTVGAAWSGSSVPGLSRGLIADDGAARRVGLHRRPPDIPVLRTADSLPPSPCGRPSRPRATTGAPSRHRAVSRRPAFPRAAWLAVVGELDSGSHVHH